MSSRGWVPSAHWMTVNDEGAPRLHHSREAAVEYARTQELVAYRQDAPTGRVDIVYTPGDGREYKPGEYIAEEYER